MAQRVHFLALAAMVGMTIWNGVDGGRSWLMIGVVCVGVVAATMILRILAQTLPQHRLLQSILSGCWVMVFLPPWDWLAGHWLWPDTVYRSLFFAVGYAVLSYFFIRRPGRQ